jgi:HEAT repeat protein
VRLAAVVALGASEDESVIDDLTPLAEDPDPWVRGAAVRAVGIRFGTSGLGEHRRKALQMLDRALGDEVLVALGAVEALTEIGGAEAMRVTALFERAEPELLMEAVTCLERHASRDALDVLLPLVCHPAWSVRAEAIRVLGARGVVRAAPSILGRLDSEQDEFVREVVLRALERLDA